MGRDGGDLSQNGPFRAFALAVLFGGERWGRVTIQLGPIPSGVRTQEASQEVREAQGGVE